MKFSHFLLHLPDESPEGPLRCTEKGKGKEKKKEERKMKRKGKEEGKGEKKDAPNKQGQLFEMREMHM